MFSTIGLHESILSKSLNDSGGRIFQDIRVGYEDKDLARTFQLAR